MNPSQPNKTVLPRRHALKILAAITGAATLASLPNSWETPLVQVGALPVHAQCSIIPGTASLVSINETGGTLDLALFNILTDGPPIRTARIGPAGSVCWTGLEPGDFYELAESISGGDCDGATGIGPLTLEADRVSQITVFCAPAGISTTVN